MGVESVAALPSPPQPLLLPRLDTPFSRAAHHVLDACRARHSAFMRLRLVTAKSAHEREFANAIVEDRTEGVMSYIEFLCDIHKRIQDLDANA